jgi:hypothetical protein
MRVLPALVAVALIVAGCGSDSGDQTTQPAKATQSAHTSTESGTQANGGFPGAGSPTAPDVTTTPGAPETESKGKAGGGSSATCIGC